MKIFKTKKNSLELAILFIGLAMVAVFVQHRIHSENTANIFEEEKNFLLNMTPLLRERLNPMEVGRERILEALSPLKNFRKEMNEDIASSAIQELHNEFGNDFSAVLFDRFNQIVGEHGVLNSLKRDITFLFSQLTIFKMESKYQLPKPKKGILSSIDNSFNYCDIDTNPATLLLRVDGKLGLAFISFFYESKMFGKYLAVTFPILRPFVEDSDSKFSGGSFIFIPMETLVNQDFLCKVWKKPIPEMSTFHFEWLDKNNSNLPTTAGKATEKLAKSDAGKFFTEEYPGGKPFLLYKPFSWNGGCLRISMKNSRALNYSFSGGWYILFFAVILVSLSFFWLFSKKTWAIDWEMSKIFSVITLFPAFLLGICLLWLFTSDAIYGETIIEPGSLINLENTLRKYDRVEAGSENEFVSKIHIFLEEHNWESSFPTDDRKGNADSSF
ncbi:MAG: hypothetical protein HQM08_27210 [Candidatus Riflebacteria bacterium]|nr:hypothetical protein [Candidatus Riflebacteria bacterium]